MCKVAMQGQRAGVQASDSVSLFPNIWEWKKPGYENICQGFLQTLTPAERQNVDFKNFPGYFEAGSTAPSSARCPPFSAACHGTLSSRPAVPQCPCIQQWL